MNEGSRKNHSILKCSRSDFDKVAFFSLVYFLFIVRLHDHLKCSYRPNNAFLLFIALLLRICILDKQLLRITNFEHARLLYINVFSCSCQYAKSFSHSPVAYSSIASKSLSSMVSRICSKAIFYSNTNVDTHTHTQFASTFGNKINTTVAKAFEMDANAPH